MSDRREFSVVLGGGGARGFAHAGVLRGLEAEGMRPAAIVGVSMGAVVGAAYAHRPDWYDALLGFDVSAFPGPTVGRDVDSVKTGTRIRGALKGLGLLKEMVVGWGPGSDAREPGLAELHDLLGTSSLQEGRVPLAVAATDLRSGERVVMTTGSVPAAVYASAALAGVVPPLEREGRLLADGAYTDLAPVDVARGLVSGPVLAVDPGQPSGAGEIRSGYQALIRAMEICHRQHAELRFRAADVALRVEFRRTIRTLDFDARRECVAAGLRAVRGSRRKLRRALGRGDP